MYLALIKAGSYLDFINPVPFSGPEGIIESGVLNEAGRISGRAQAAVRPLSVLDFNRIVSLGVEEHEFELPRTGAQPSNYGGFGEEVQAPFVFEQQRDRVMQLSSRIVRDRLF